MNPSPLLAPSQAAVHQQYESMHQVTTASSQLASRAATLSRLHLVQLLPPCLSHQPRERPKGNATPYLLQRKSGSPPSMAGEWPTLVSNRIRLLGNQHLPTKSTAASTAGGQNGSGHMKTLSLDRSAIKASPAKTSPRLPSASGSEQALIRPRRPSTRVPARTNTPSIGTSSARSCSPPTAAAS